MHMQLNPPKMCFYSAVHDGQPGHPDMALLKQPNLPVIDSGLPNQIHCVALALPSREAWLEQLAYIQSRGIKFESRVEHLALVACMFTIPTVAASNCSTNFHAKCWSNDINGAVNYCVALPTEGPEAIANCGDSYPIFAGAAA